jgi:hypothetical protein
VVSGHLLNFFETVVEVAVEEDRIDREKVNGKSRETAFFLFLKDQNFQNSQKKERKKFGLSIYIAAWVVECVERSPFRIFIF